MDNPYLPDGSLRRSDDKEKEKENQKDRGDIPTATTITPITSVPTSILTDDDGHDPAAKARPTADNTVTSTGVEDSSLSTLTSSISTDVTPTSIQQSLTSVATTPFSSIISTSSTIAIQATSIHHELPPAASSSSPSLASSTGSGTSSTVVIAASAGSAAGAIAIITLILFFWIRRKRSSGSIYSQQSGKTRKSSLPEMSSGRKSTASMRVMSILNPFGGRYTPTPRGHTPHPTLDLAPIQDVRELEQRMKEEEMSKRKMSTGWGGLKTWTQEQNKRYSDIEIGEMNHKRVGSDRGTWHL